jgi:hypothetical protein
MPKSAPRYLAVRVTPEDHEILTRYRLQVAAEIGRDISTGKFIAFLVEVGKNHHDEILALVRRD